MIEIKCSHSVAVPLVDLVVHPENPNTHPKKQIEVFGDILVQHGWRVPITVSNLSGYIVRGHRRYYTALSLGEDVVPVDFQDYDSQELELADLAADNRIPEMSERDDILLARLLEKVQVAPAVDLELTGYSDQDLQKLNQRLSQKKKEKVNLLRQ